MLAHVLGMDALAAAILARPLDAHDGDRTDVAAFARLEGVRLAVSSFSLSRARVSASRHSMLLSEDTCTGSLIISSCFNSTPVTSSRLLILRFGVADSSITSEGSRRLTARTNSVAPLPPYALCASSSTTAGRSSFAR